MLKSLFSKILSITAKVQTGAKYSKKSKAKATADRSPLVKDIIDRTARTIEGLAINQELVNMGADSNKIPAPANVALITFSAEATAGTWAIAYDGVSSSAIEFDDTAPAIESALIAIEGLEEATVSGDSLAGYVITLPTGLDANLLSIEDNTLVDINLDPVDITIEVQE